MSAVITLGDYRRAIAEEQATLDHYDTSEAGRVILYVRFDKRNWGPHDKEKRRLTMRENLRERAPIGVLVIVRDVDDPRGSYR